MGLQEKQEFDLSMVQLQEEINEIMEAYENADFIGLVDGLIDLEYFLLGVMYKCGLDAESHRDIFTAVHNCNVKKVMGVKAGREGFDAADAVKPEDWVPPEEMIDGILTSIKAREFSGSLNDD